VDKTAQRNPTKEHTSLAALDNPVWSALTGPQRDLGRSTPLAARFHPDVSPFGGFAGEPTARHWIDLARLVAPGESVVLVGSPPDPPPGWEVLWEGTGVQMVGDRLHPESPAPTVPSTLSEPLVLGPDDSEDMLALVAETRPGPFQSRTVEFGGYLGIRHEGRLIAMAGERLRPDGFAEVSAVATHPDHRNQGLAELLVRAVAAGIAGRDETPFLHASGDNVGAIRLYLSMGFVVRRTLTFGALQPPETV
jgi:ribosomal protein S18 acetylase RimI-like enzyme